MRGTPRSPFAAFVLAAFALCAFAPSRVAAGKPAEACTRLGPRDVLIAVCLQNDFLDERPADGSYALGASRSYAVPEAHTRSSDDTSEAVIRRGTLAVGGSERVIPVANEWMRRVDDAGGTVIATMDWHPPEHCSFCRFGPDLESRLDCTWGCDGVEGICVTGAGVPSAVFDASRRCVDPVSDVDFQQSRYFQWPPHCVADSFGSRFDPFLRVPPRAVKVHAGYDADHDSYSAFGARELATEASLADVLESSNPRRVFVLGLATDYVVKETLADLVRRRWDLGRNTSGDELDPDPDTKEKEKGGSTPPDFAPRSILVAAGSRGVFDAPGSYFGSDPATGSGRAKRDLREAGVSIVAGARVDDALLELCEGTCDRDADCDPDPSDGREMICAKPLPGESFGRCSRKPVRAEGLLLPLSIATAALLGTLAVFRDSLVDVVVNGRKRRGPPTDFVVLVETDIEGSSELWETMGAAGMGDVMKDGVMATHDEVLRRSMRRHFGYELFVRGDAFVVAFHAVDDALAWCLQVQLDLMAAAWPAEVHDATAGTRRVWGTYEGLRVRMGVHCGKVSSATKHQGKVVYEGEVTRQVTGIADAGVGGQIIMSQATLPLPANLVDAPFTVFDQGMHRVKGFDQPQRLKEVYPESLATRGSDGWAAKKLDTEERLSPSFHAAPEGLVTMIYCHAEGLAELKLAVSAEAVDRSLEVMAETLRAAMVARGGYDCRGHERNGENMYTFASYVDCALFAVEAQRALDAADWPEAVLAHNEARDQERGTTGEAAPRARGLRVRMGMHSGQLKRIRIPSEGLADYYGESANRAARVMSTAIGGQVVCVASELEYFLDAYAGATPRLLVDPMGVFALKGIPGQTALVQLSLDERTAGFGSRKFVESKKAQRISPGDKFARVVIEAMEATEIGASATVDAFDAGSPKAKPGGSSGWKTLRGAVGKKRSGGKDNLLAGLSDITGSSRQLSSRRWSGEGAE